MPDYQKQPRQLSPEEYEAIKQQVLAGMEPGMDEASFQRQIGPRMAAALAKAQSSPPPPEGSALWRFGAGLVETLNPIAMAKGVYQLGRHPIDTTTGLVNQQLDQFRKGGEAIDQGRYVEGVAHNLAGAVPIIGPAAARAGEEIQAGNTAGGLGQGTGLLVPFAAAEAMRLRAAGRAGRLEQQAAEQVANKVLAPGNPRYVGRAQAIAPEVLQRGLSGDRGALRETAQAGMDTAAQAIDDAVTAAGGATAKVPVQPIVQALNAKLAELLTRNGQPIEGAAGRAQALQARIDQLQQIAGKTGAVTYEELKQIRDVNYGVAASAHGYERAGNAAMGDAGWAARETGSAIREQFAQHAPDAAKANADYSFFKTLDEILDPAKGRPKATAPTQGVTGGAAVSGAVAGAVTGSKTAAFVMSVVRPWLQKQLASDAWQMADASRKYKLADALRKGDTTRAVSIMRTWMKYGPKEVTSPSELQTAPAGP